MYNLYIYSDYKTIIHQNLNYWECITKLIKGNVKKGFKLVPIMPAITRPMSLVSK